jgi:hypothetical protein
MGANLIASCVMIERTREPDWTKAKQHIAALSEDECLSLMLEVCYGEPDIAAAADYGLTGEDARARIIRALNTCKSGWNGEERCLVSMTVVDRVLLLGAGTSWGDPIEEADDVTLFAVCGAAKAAGFLSAS